MASIPNKVFQKYEELADCMIDDLGVLCQLIYPPLTEACNNCVYDPIGKKSANRYKHGGPAPFNFGKCPVCGGAGYKEVEQTETVTMRVYTDSKSFRRFAEVVDVSLAQAVVIGYVFDMDKFQKANEIVVDYHMKNHKLWKYKRGSQVSMWGMKHRRYFIATLEKVDG